MQLWVIGCHGGEPQVCDGISGHEPCEGVCPRLRATFEVHEVIVPHGYLCRGVSYVDKKMHQNEELGMRGGLPAATAATAAATAGEATTT